MVQKKERTWQNVGTVVVDVVSLDVDVNLARGGKSRQVVPRRRQHDKIKTTNHDQWHG